MASFGIRLRYWRRRAGLTQAQLGVRLGYHHSQISKLESGQRDPQDGFPEKADELLQTGGELTAIWEASVPFAPLGPVSPLPGQVIGFSAADRTSGGSRERSPADRTSGGSRERSPAALTTGSWPTRFPAHGLPCPVHGSIGCAAPTPLDAISAYMEMSTPDSEMLHALTALLAGYSSVSMEQTNTDVLFPVERILHSLMPWIETQPVMRLAAHYAQLAGWLRVLRGQHGLGMSWFDHGMRWAGTSNDVIATVLLLSNMSMLARLERDPQTAGTYAQALTASAPGRRWVALTGRLYEARAHALATNLDGCERSISHARSLLSRLDDRDHHEAPWLSGGEGHTRVDAAASGALRDIAVATNDKALALKAVAATQQSLAYLPTRMLPTRMLLTLRLADAYACAGRPDAAIATAEPIAVEAAAVGRTTIQRELRGLRQRLTQRWPDLREVKEFVERL